MTKSEENSDRVKGVLEWARKSKFLSALIISGVVVISVGGVFSNLDNIITFCRKYFVEESTQEKGNEHAVPSAEDITALGKRALWSNEYLGSREAYSQLLDWKDSSKDPMTIKLLSAEIKRVEDDYRTDIMRLHIDRWLLIWVPHVNGKEGFVKSEGFLAGNVLAHLSPNRRADERARAACILRNIKTSSDKDSIDKNEFYEKLIRHMGDQETSLTVSKMALETYKDLTGFSSNGVFDFEGALKDWEERKDEILKINF